MATGLELIISTICNASFCEAVYDNPLIDTQLTKKQEDVMRLTSELNGKHLKIATYNNYPLSWVEKHDNGTLTGHGVAFDVVDILREKFNFTFEVVIPEKNFEIGGSKPEDSLIGLVNSSAVDMAAAFLPILSKFRRKVKFSTFLDEGVWMMMLKRPKESAAGSGLLAPFDNRVWYLILAAVLSYGPCITLLTKLRSKLVRDKERQISISPSFWFVYGAFIKQGTTMAPEANLSEPKPIAAAKNGVNLMAVGVGNMLVRCYVDTTRVLFATWWIFIILLSAFYTANLTAFLTLSKFTLDIENTEDLYKKNYRWVSSEGSAVQYVIKDPDEDLFYLSRMIANGRAQFRSFQEDRDFLPLVVGGAVLIKEQTAIDHVMYGDYLTKAREGVEEADRCTYVVAPNAFMRIPRAFAFGLNSTLRDLFEPVITYLLQAGIVDFLEYRDLPSTKICPLDLQSKDRRLRNSDLMMTYMIMVTGLATAFVVFIGETVFKRYIRVKFIKDGTEKRKKKASKKIRFKNRDDSRPPPYDSLFGRNPRYKVTENGKKKIINGREYYTVDTISGDTRLIPVRTPSAFLYQ